MMNQPLFIGDSGRCKQHNNIVAQDDSECEACKIISRNLSLTPPFDVLCVRNWNGCKKGSVYSVFWVIEKGKSGYKELRGYIFKDNNGNVIPSTHDADDFIPLEFLTKEEREEIGKEEEQIEEATSMCGMD